jgi:polysaccharide export outer membrane protein
MEGKRYFIGLTVLMFSFCMLGTISCSLPPDYSTLPPSLAVGAAEAKPYLIQGGDILEVKFPYTEKHNEEVTVRPDGYVTTQIAGELKAADRSPAEVAAEIKQRSASRLRDPKVVVVVKQSVQKVYVGGEVYNPSAVPYHEGLTALQAIFQCGGFRDTAKWNTLMLVRMEKDAYKATEMNLDSIATYPLAANDVIFIPKTGVAKANLAVKQYVRDMLPIPTGLSANP